jgi:hypothetical protein
MLFIKKLIKYGIIKLLQNYYAENMEELIMEINDRVEFLENDNKGKQGTVIKLMGDHSAVVVVDGDEDDVPTLARVTNLKVISK